jgi:steroid 5-alpha reductase family enzyme
LSLYPSLVESGSYFSYLDVFAISITLLAIIVESVADKQLKRFIEERESHKKIMKEGIWKYSRHPNYFGEILFWWGLYSFALASNLNFWWTIIGPISITLLFIFISIPLMDERNLNRRPQYEEYMEKTSKLVPWRKR